MSGSAGGAARVVIVAPVHRYDDVRVFQKEAKTLARNGYEVSLLARAPVPLEEDGVRVVPLPAPTWRGARFAMLPLILVRALAERGDIYHLHNPDTLPLALWLRMLGKRVVYDTHEDFSQRLLVRSWIPRFIRPALAWSVAFAEGMVARIVDLPIATQPDVQERLSRQALLLQNPPIISGPLIDHANARARELNREEDVFRLVYVGGITKPRGLFTMLDAMAIANQAVACRLWLIGPFMEGDQPRAEAHPGWRFVDYLGPLPQAEAFAHIARSDAGLATVLDVGGHRNINPNKLFEYQVFGIPFIASDFASWREVMAGAEAGIFVDPADPVAAARAVQHLAENPEECRRMGAAGMAFVSNYNWENESRKLLSAYESILRRPERHKRIDSRRSSDVGN